MDVTRTFGICDCTLSFRGTSDPPCTTPSRRTRPQLLALRRCASKTLLNRCALYTFPGVRTVWCARGDDRLTSRGGGRISGFLSTLSWLCGGVSTAERQWREVYGRILYGIPRWLEFQGVYYASQSAEASGRYEDATVRAGFKEFTYLGVYKSIS